MSWHEGYVTEIQYTHGFYRELTPALLRFVQLIRSVRSPSSSGRTSYCELGCGQGFSMNLLAAANPDIDFHANDFNPGQIAGARHLAFESGLTNVHFHESSFADFANAPNLPESFDIIALHGIYSWISEKNRKHIIDFVRDRLRPGGLVYVSYNTLPGWAAAMPLRRLMVERGRQIPGTIVDKIDGAIDFIGKMQAANGNYFAQTPTFAARLDKLKTAPRSYLAHEYMNADWAPEYFSDVAAHFGDAKVDYLGSAHLHDNLDALNLSAEMVEVLAAEKDPMARESLRDFMINQEFRRDVYTKGIIPLPLLNARQAWADTRFVLSTPRDLIPLKVVSKRGEISLKEEIYAPILDFLANGPKTGAQMLAQPAIAALGWDNLQQALLVQIGMNNVQPCLPADKDKHRSRSTRSFNAAVMKRAELTSDLSFLASPVTGGGVTVERFHQLFISAIHQGRSDAPEWIWSLLEASGQRLLKDQKAMQTREEHLDDLRDRQKIFNEQRLPLYRQLGIV